MKKPRKCFGKHIYKTKEKAALIAKKHEKQMYIYECPNQYLPEPDSDMEFRSLCSQKFAQAFYLENK